MTDQRKTAWCSSTLLVSLEVSSVFFGILAIQHKFLEIQLEVLNLVELISSIFETKFVIQLIDPTEISHRPPQCRAEILFYLLHTDEASRDD